METYQVEFLKNRSLGRLQYMVNSVLEDKAAVTTNVHSVTVTWVDDKYLAVVVYTTFATPEKD